MIKFSIMLILLPGIALGMQAPRMLTEKQQKKAEASAEKFLRRLPLYKTIKECKDDASTETDSESDLKSIEEQELAKEKQQRERNERIFQKEKNLTKNPKIAEALDDIPLDQRKSLARFLRGFSSTSTNTTIITIIPTDDPGYDADNDPISKINKFKQQLPKAKLP